MRWSHPQGEILRLLESPVRFLVADGTVRSGKSTVLVAGFLLWSGRNFREHMFMLSSKTLRQIRDTLMPVMEEICDEASVHFRHRRNDKIIEVGDNEFYLQDGLDSSAAQRLQGRTLAGALIDEAPLLPQDFLDEAITRCSVPGAKICLTGNPAGGPSHWFARRFMEGTAAVVKSCMLDNLGINAEYISDVTESLSGTALKRRVLGHWAPAVGAVYPIFILDRPPDEPPSWRFVSIDHALASTTAALLWGVWGDRAWVVQEYIHDGYVAGMVDDATLWGDIHLTFNLQSHPVHAVVVDPAALGLKAALKARGVHVVDAHNDVLAGIEHCNAHLSEGRVRIAPHLYHLRGELDSYSWDPIASQRGEDKVIKEHDHAVDSLRYGSVFLSQAWGAGGRSLAVEVVPLRRRKSQWQDATDIRMGGL